MMKLTVVIPCLNEIETLGMCIDEIQQVFSNHEWFISQRLVGEIVIADNGSIDGSQALAKEKGARVVDVAEKGYGSALHYGIMSISEGIVVFADADMSYPFYEIPKLVQPILDKQADFVLGSRLNGKIEKLAMPLLNRYIATPILSGLIRLIYKIPASDCNSGMRAFLKDKYNAWNLVCPGMEYASEMLIAVAKDKSTIYQEVPIDFRKDRRSRAPHMKRWQDGWRHLRFIFANASSDGFLILPATLAFLMLLVSLGLTFGETTHTKNYLALLSLGAASPLLLISMGYLGLKSMLSKRLHSEEDLIKTIYQVINTSVLFYISSFLFFLAAVFLLIAVASLIQSSFIMAMPFFIRCLVFIIMGTFFIISDMCLGMIALIPMRKGRY